MTNLIRMNARMILTIQLQMLSSSQIKYQILLKIPFPFILFINAESIKKVVLFGYHTMRHNYFEGIFQLRSPTREVLEFIEHDLAQKGTVFITKRRRLKDGFDMYMTSQRY